MLFAATATTAMLHANSPLAAWPWLALAVHGVDGRLIDTIASQISKQVVDNLGGRLRVVREKHRESADKALALETVRRGLTPATDRARKAWWDHRRALRETKQALDVAKKERDELWKAAKAADQRVREAQAAYGATFRAIDHTGRVDLDSRHTRKCELQIARVEEKLARKEAEKAERVLAADLQDIYRAYPRQETVIALARLLGTSKNELMVLMGLRKKRELNDDEQSAFARRVMAGEPVVVLMREYHISKWQAYSLLQDCKKIETITNPGSVGA